MKYAVFLTATLVLTSPSFGQIKIVQEKKDSPQAVEILREAYKVATELNSISYQATMIGEGTQAPFMSLLEGRVQAKRAADPQQPKIYIEGSHTPPNTRDTPPEPSAFKFASNGEEAWSMTEKSRLFASGEAENARTIERSNLFPPRYFDGSAYEAALQHATLSYEGLQTIDGVECHVIRANYQTAHSWERLYIGKDDHLLRRQEIPIMASRQSAPRGRESLIIFAANGLKVNPEISDEIFKLSAPDGYEHRTFPSVQRTLTADGRLSRQASRPSSKNVGGKSGDLDAPDWVLPDANGHEVSLKSLRGKVVVLDFWATWCGPCKMAMPGLEKLHNQFKDKPVAVFGVNCMERNPKADPMAYIKQRGYTYPQLLNGTHVAAAYGVRGIPAFYVINREGNVIHQGSGFRPGHEQELADIIEKALESPPTAGPS